MTDHKIEQNALNDLITEQFLIYRGTILTSFAQVEWFMAKILVEAHAFPEYANLNLDFSIQADTRAKKLRILFDAEGPLRKYRDSLIPIVDEVMGYAESRNFMAHGVSIGTPSEKHGITFRVKMFKQMKGGEEHEGKIDFTIGQLGEESKALSAAAVRFIRQIRTIWQDLGMTTFDVF